MKKVLSVALTLLLALCTMVALTSCGGNESIWDDAIYRTDKSFGSGETEISVTVRAYDEEVVFTVKTNASDLATALLEHELIDGEIGDYGFTVYVVNGMTADWRVDGSYWAMYSGGEYLMTGASDTLIANGESYEFVYTPA